MSRIGKLPISIPAGVTINVSDDNKVTVKGPKGEMSQTVDPSIKVNIADGEVTFEIVEENAWSSHSATHTPSFFSFPLKSR